LICVLKAVQHMQDAQLGQASSVRPLPNLETRLANSGLNDLEIFSLIIGYFRGWVVSNLRDNFPMTYLSLSG
jgi:hypothetical protein